MISSMSRRARRALTGFSRSRRLVALPVVALLALCVSPVWAQNQNQNQITAERLVGPVVSDFGPGYKDVDAAIERFMASDFEGARSLLAEAKKKHPELGPVQTLMAQLFIGTNRLPLARVELERAVIESPNDPEAYLIMGELALAQRWITDADLLISHGSKLNESLKGSPTRQKHFQTVAHIGLASVAEARQQWPAAEQHLAAWVKAKPENTTARQRYAGALFRNGKIKEAYAQLQAASKQDKNLLPADIAMGRLYESAGDHQNAIKSFTQAVKQAPNDVNTLLAAAQWAITSNELKAAKSYLDSALKANPDSLDGKLLAGVLARLSGDNKTAEKYLEEVHLKAPDNFQATNVLALLMADDKDPERQRRALGFAEINAKKYPKNPEALATLGWVLYRLGHMPEAEQVLNAALSSGALSADSAYFVANVLERKGRREDAKKLLAKALETKEPFTYRTAAEEMSTRLSNAPRTPAANTPSSSKSKSGS